MTTRRTGKPLPYIRPSVSGTNKILVGGRLTWGVPPGALVRPGSDDTTTYVLVPSADGGSLHLLRAVGDHVMELNIVPALAAAIRQKAFPGR